MKPMWWIVIAVVAVVLIGTFAYTQMSPANSTSSQIQPIATTTSVDNTTVGTNPAPPVTTGGNPPKPVPVPTPQPETGALVGTVTISPTCPVETNPPSANCAPKPFVTEVTISRSGTTLMQVTTAHTKSDGTFEVTLSPGTYIVSASSGNPYPRCSPVTTHVTNSTRTNVAISCDSGIR